MIATVALFMCFFVGYGLRVQQEYTNQSINESMNQSMLPSEGYAGFDYLDDIYQRVELHHKKVLNDSNMEPFMTREERWLFYKYLDRARHYQEFGSGGSTVVALAHPNISKVHTVESDRRWIHYLRNRSDISSAIAHKRLELVYANIGPMRKYGYPKDLKSRAKWTDYSGKAAESGVKFDLILVDGRFRVACFLKALQRILPEDRNQTTLMIHDYYVRKSYRIIENFATFVKRTSRLAVFQKKERVDEGELAKTIAKFDNVVD
eukprot:gnl/TRDRNA2_/TRDRNA2_175609_c0_seq6.p1 gnl/TRDRNA2_/TRDRNA2_175609_c0~~gnl/TRDRNA2_/TRDRNA2_175609_c0_seq6.p1  ORF type:complete len:294 (+),score=30.37 gnl/TRDRNA2_/TRDRNA2_175609_c0_seq6:95-883(+)